MAKRVDLIKGLSDLMVGEETLVITPIGSTTPYWEELGSKGPRKSYFGQPGNVHSYCLGSGAGFALPPTGSAGFGR